jgi:hypothetical protein
MNARQMVREEASQGCLGCGPKTLGFSLGLSLCEICSAEFAGSGLDMKTWLYERGDVTQIPPTADDRQRKCETCKGLVTVKRFWKIISPDQDATEGQETDYALAEASGDWGDWAYNSIVIVCRGRLRVAPAVVVGWAKHGVPADMAVDVERTLIYLMKEQLLARRRGCPSQVARR